MPFPDEAFAHRVEVSAYREEWAAEGAAYVELLRELVPDAVAVDHIGSTSVPGLPAKDCLDLMVQVETLDEAGITGVMAARGFRVRPEAWNHDEVTDGVSHPKLVFAPSAGARSVNIHVRVAGGRNVRYALLFRDFLRADTDARDAWGAFKTRLAETVTDIYDYGQIKASIQPLLMQRAERWAAEVSWRSPSIGETPPVLGVDGCRAGWVGALLRGTTYDVLVADDIASLVATARRAAPGLAVVAVDMPIGLPDVGPRGVDVLARQLLPVGRKSSVFPTPARAATLVETLRRGERGQPSSGGQGSEPAGVSADPEDPPGRSLRPVRGSGAGAGGAPRGQLRRDRPGLRRPVEEDDLRARLHAAPHCRSVGLEPPAYVPGQGYAADDLLDACVVAWTAARYADGTAYSLPDPPEIFSDGIPAAIWV